MSILLVILYIVGYVLCYILFKKYMTMRDEDEEILERSVSLPDWTVGDRLMTMCMSTLSWVGCVVTLICIWAALNEDKPAKW